MPVMFVISGAKEGKEVMIRMTGQRLWEAEYYR